MAWEARSGLKPHSQMNTANVIHCWNGLGGPFGIETEVQMVVFGLR